jgi:hypothetical protein
VFPTAILREIPWNRYLLENTLQLKPFSDNINALATPLLLGIILLSTGFLLHLK